KYILLIVKKMSQIKAAFLYDLNNKAIKQVYVLYFEKPRTACNFELAKIIKMETIHKAPIALKTGAIAEVLRLMAQPDFDTRQLLRVGVKGGGCSGMSYVLGFDEKDEDDEQYEIEGIQVIMKKAHG